MVEELSKSVSYSELYTYMKCPRKHRLSYIERLHKQESKQASKRMNLGSIVHELLENSLKLYYNTNYKTSLESMYSFIEGAAEIYANEYRPKPEMFDDGETVYILGEDEQTSWDQDLELGIKIAKRTIKHLDIPNKWRIEAILWENEVVPLIEWKFQYPLFADRNLVGVIDVVMRSLEDNQIYLIDWKTRATLLDDFEIGAEHMSMQLSLYQHVLNSLGVNVAGTITYQIKSSIPNAPAITQGGKVSRAKISSDYDTFMATVVANGQSPDEYADMVFQSDDYWFRPITVIRNEYELQQRWQNVQIIAERMVNDLLAPKYESPDCVFCPFFRICLGEDVGWDNEYYLETNYVKGE